MKHSDVGVRYIFSKLLQNEVSHFSLLVVTSLSLAHLGGTIIFDTFNTCLSEFIVGIKGIAVIYILSLLPYFQLRELRV